MDNLLRNEVHFRQYSQKMMHAAETSRSLRKLENGWGSQKTSVFNRLRQLLTPGGERQGLAYPDKSTSDRSFAES